MAKDRRARAENHVTVMALANLLAALVDTMREAGVENGVIHSFLDRLEHMNAISLSGMAGEILENFIEIVRGTVPSND